MNEFLKQCWTKFRLLPLLIVVAGLAFVVRVGEATLEVKSLSGAAYAAAETIDKTKEKTEDKVEGKTEDKAKDEIKKTEPEKADVKEEAKEEVKADTAATANPEKADTPKTKTDWKDAGDTDIEYSSVRDDVYKDLLARRQQLDAREKELAKREALVTATRDEIKAKVQELNSLKTEIQGLLKKQTDEEQANVTRLVKIYEGMKPKDAARIFNALDTDVLISVISKMTEKKSALIIAAMDADKARTVTLMLSEQKKLPDLNVGQADSNREAPAESLPVLGQERDQAPNAAETAPPPAPPLTKAPDSSAPADPPA